MNVLKVYPPQVHIVAVGPGIGQGRPGQDFFQEQPVVPEQGFGEPGRKIQPESGKVPRRAAVRIVQDILFRFTDAEILLIFDPVYFGVDL